MAEILKSFPIGIGQLQPTGDDRKAGFRPRLGGKIKASIPNPGKPPRPPESLSVERCIG